MFALDATYTPTNKTLNHLLNTYKDPPLDVHFRGMRKRPFLAQSPAGPAFDQDVGAMSGSTAYDSASRPSSFVAQTVEGPRILSYRTERSRYRFSAVSSGSVDPRSHFRKFVRR